MERYIGIDVHQASCTVAVLSETGRQLRVMVVETNGEALVGTIRSVAGRRHVVLEEGTQAGWLVGVLQGHAAEVVVAQVAASRGQKSDERDAYGLAEALRVGTIQRVFKDPHCFRDLGQRARVYRMLTGDLVRIKNRLKSLFRARAITAAGQKLYNPCHRAEWLGKLDSASCLVAEPLFEQLDAVRELQLRAQCAMVETSHRHPVSRRLETIPGLGSIRVAQLLPIVVTPSRFRTRRQLWVPTNCLAASVGHPDRSRWSAARSLQAVQDLQRRGWQHHGSEHHPLEAVRAGEAIGTEGPVQQVSPGCPARLRCGTRSAGQHIGGPLLPLGLAPSPGTGHHRVAPGGTRCQHSVVQHLVLVGWGDQGRQPLDQLHAGEHDRHGPIRPGPLQLDPHRTILLLLHPVSSQRGAGDVPAQSLQSPAIPGTHRHTGMHGVAVAGGTSCWELVRSSAQQLDSAGPAPPLDS